MTKARQKFYRTHRETVVDDILESARQDDWEEVEDMFFNYGRFLERHPEALEVV